MNQKEHLGKNYSLSSALKGLLINLSIPGSQQVWVQDYKFQTDNTCTHKLMTALSLDQW
mgnify:CR=1 FL=1